MSADSFSPYRIIGYVMGRADIHRMGVDRLTHINYAFAHINESGEVFLPYPNASTRLAQLQALKAKNPRLKILVSVGGWGADGFSDAALNTSGSKGRPSSSLWSTDSVATFSIKSVRSLSTVGAIKSTLVATALSTDGSIVSIASAPALAF